MTKKLVQSGGLEDSDGVCSFNERFLKSTLRISRMANEVGIIVLPCTNIKLPYFSKLESMQKASIVRQLESYESVLEATTKKFGCLKNNSSLVWTGIKQLDLVQPSDFFARLDNNDVVEVYGMNEALLFANLRFFHLSSYTLEQLYVFPWENLYQRDDSIVKLIQAGVASVLNSGKRESLDFENNTHTIQEVSSVFKLKFSYSLKSLTPLYDRKTKSIAAFASISKINLLSHIPKVEEQAMLDNFYQQISVVG